MKILPVQMMEKALEIVPQSPHPTNKIAACIWNPDNPSEFVTKTNSWPSFIEDKIGRDKRIGNASSTIHAETNMIFSAPFPTEGTYASVTEPLCPNCAKNIAEAGIKRIYIDQNGFDKDFFNRRGNEFTEMSMRIFEHAGISVYAITSEGRIKSILEINENYQAPNDHPIIANEIDTVSNFIFETKISDAHNTYGDKKFSVCFAKDPLGTVFCISATSHVVEGFTVTDSEQVEQLLNEPGKYTYIQESLNRTLMYLSRKGLTLVDDFLYCSEVPTSREQVNMVGAEISIISIGDRTKSRDEHGFLAKELLSEKKIISYLDIQ